MSEGGRGRREAERTDKDVCPTGRWAIRRINPGVWLVGWRTGRCPVARAVGIEWMCGFPSWREAMDAVMGVGL